ESDAPGIARALAENLEVLRPRMNAEQSAGELVLLAAVLDVAVVEDAVEAIEPAVGPPGERVGQLVRVGAAKAGDDDFRLAGRLAVGPLAVEEDVRRVGHPDAAVADRDAGGDVEALGEDGDLVVVAVAAGALQDLDAVAPRAGGTARVFEALGDP